MSDLPKMDKHLPKMDKLGASSLSSCSNISKRKGEPFFYGGFVFSKSDPFVEAAQDVGFCLFCAISHRTKLSQRSRPDGWVTLPGNVARDLFGLTPGKVSRAVHKCVAAGLLEAKKGKGKTARWKYRFAFPINRRRVSPAERPRLTETDVC
jgi:hypothetical protein